MPRVHGQVDRHRRQAPDRSGDGSEAKQELGQEVRYNAVTSEVYRSFGFPGPEDLGNMFRSNATSMTSFARRASSRSPGRLAPSCTLLTCGWPATRAGFGWSNVKGRIGVMEHWACFWSIQSRTSLKAVSRTRLGPRMGTDKLLELSHLIITKERKEDTMTLQPFNVRTKTCIKYLTGGSFHLSVRLN